MPERTRQSGRGVCNITRPRTNRPRDTLEEENLVNEPGSPFTFNRRPVVTDRYKRSVPLIYRHARILSILRFSFSSSFLSLYHARSE